MKVAEISNQLSFKKIFYPENQQFSPTQYLIKKDIKDSLEGPRERFNGESAVEHYEKENIDFMIIPAEKHKVLLRGIVGSQPAWKDVPNGIIYEYHFDIGKYDKVHPFKISEIEPAKKDGKIKNIGTFVILLIAIALSTLMIAKRFVARSKLPKTQLIENAQDVLNKSNALKQDTLNIFR